VLSPREAAEFTNHFRPLAETGTGRERRALAYLTAVKLTKDPPQPATLAVEDL
jgi:hypothetical protein